MAICENLSLGLAMWHTNDAFKDMQTITGSNNGFFNKPAWTALNNANKKSCNSAQECNGKLVALNQQIFWLYVSLIFHFSYGSRHQQGAPIHSLVKLGIRLSRESGTGSAIS